MRAVIDDTKTAMLAAKDSERPALPTERYRSGLRWRPLWLAAFALTEIYFLAFFQQDRWQPTVDLAWMLAVAGWVLAFWSSERPLLPRLRHPYWFYALYAAVLLPFATNWRWAMAADTLTWPLGGMSIAEHGPARSLLSVNGPDNFGYLQMVLHNGFMLVAAPTLFWHRVGQIAVGVLALAAVYTVFARVVSPWFGLLIAGCSASTSVWIVYTYASYPFIDGLASGYALLAIGLWVQRSPESQKAWLTLGLLSGLMLFLTPNGWFIAVFVWAWLGSQVLLRGWPLSRPLLAGITGLVAGLPMLIQWYQGAGKQLFSLVQNPSWTAEKVLRFLQQAAFMPFASHIEGAGAFGPQLPPFFRWLCVPGFFVALALSRRFQKSRLLVCLYLMLVVVLALAEGPYVEVSVKRALVLIPLATYFAFLPFERLLRSAWVVLPVLAIWASFGVYDVVARIQPGRTGYTLLDGIVEVNQRLSDVPVCVVISKDAHAEPFAPNSALDRLFRITPHLQRVRDASDPACQQALCYAPAIDALDLQALGFSEIRMLNSVELRCGRKRAH